jgi:hypothetical protein
MPITQAFTLAAKQAMLNGTHQTGHVYKIALYTSAATLSNATTVYSTTNEVVGTGYTAGGATLSGRTVSLDGTTAVMTFNNATWPSSTITARGAIIYNDTAAGKPVVSVHDFGSDVTSTNGTFTAPMPAATAAAGVIRIA